MVLQTQLQIKVSALMFISLVGHPLDQWNPETYVKEWVLKRRKKQVNLRRVIFTTRGCFLLVYTGGVAEIDHEALNGVN